MRLSRSITRSPSRANQAGMTLIEIIIVIVLIGAVLAIVGSQIFSSKDRAEAKLAKIQVEKVANAIHSYQMDTQKLPGSLEALVADPGESGWLGPYAKPTELKDPWGHPLDYRVPGGSKPFDLISLGKDGEVGGSSVDADIQYE